MSGFSLDDTDLEILQSLDRRGELDAEGLAEKLGVSPSTIYYRVEQYREHGFLRGPVFALDANELGFELTAITEVKCSYGPEYDEIAERLKEISGVQTVYHMLGDMSFLLISKVSNREHLERVVGAVISMEGVEDSSTHIALKELDDDSVLTSYNQADLEHILDE
ncbi:Lrp/AsnC family transcriptional regulator [Haloferax sp. DFSO52]|uniref:Lrp/AsnC family transcriptional regulator n=1 Tax=Haloferax sp. DFSO52 TaxID=3388505 RepID=UPI003A856EA6